MARSFLASTTLGLLALGAGCLTLGCSTSASEQDDLGSDTQPIRRQQLPHPQGAYEAGVRASGSGCPDGTWDAALSPDGETFTVRFAAYEATVSPGVANDIKDCTLEISLGSREGIQYAMSSFYYQGYVFLEKEGMKAQHSARYHFANLRENDADRDEVSGPFDDSYLFSDTIAPPRREWTRCRRNDTLRIKTRLVLRNDPRKTGEGYMSTSTLDGTLSFRWAMNWRRCQL